MSLWEEESANLNLWLQHPEEHKARMREALLLAARAFFKGEVPVGAVLWKDGRCLYKAYNCCECTKDPLAHAEHEIAKCMIRDGLRGDDRVILYVTLQPCPMCLAMLRMLGVKTICYGASSGAPFEPRKGERVLGGVYGERSTSLLQHFFRTCRSEQKQDLGF